jgi:hypothetical protein
MWRRLLRRVHLEHGGEHDLFVWTGTLYEHVAGSTPSRTPGGDSWTAADFKISG